MTLRDSILASLERDGPQTAHEVAIRLRTTRQAATAQLSHLKRHQQIRVIDRVKVAGAKKYAFVWMFQTRIPTLPAKKVAMPVVEAPIVRREPWVRPRRFVVVEGRDMEVVWP